MNGWCKCSTLRRPRGQVLRKWVRPWQGNHFHFFKLDARSMRPKELFFKCQGHLGLLPEACTSHSSTFCSQEQILMCFGKRRSAFAAKFLSSVHLSSTSGIRRSSLLLDGIAMLIAPQASSEKSCARCNHSVECTIHSLLRFVVSRPKACSTMVQVV